jgi:hypothetical protein
LPKQKKLGREPLDRRGKFCLTGNRCTIFFGNGATTVLGSGFTRRWFEMFAKRWEKAAAELHHADNFLNASFGFLFLLNN